MLIKDVRFKHLSCNKQQQFRRYMANIADTAGNIVLFQNITHFARQPLFDLEPILHSVQCIGTANLALTVHRSRANTILKRDLRIMHGSRSLYK